MTENSTSFLHYLITSLVFGKNIVKAQGDLDLFQDTWEYKDEKSHLSVFFLIDLSLM